MEKNALKKNTAEQGGGREVSVIIVGVNEEPTSFACMEMKKFIMNLNFTFTVQFYFLCIGGLSGVIPLMYLLLATFRCSVKKTHCEVVILFF